MIKPYFETELGKLYHGDCREILPGLQNIETIITDPMWPNANVKINGHRNTYQLFAEMCKVIPVSTKRLIVQLGCDSDPRFLNGIPSNWNFLRTCWLDYTKPSYKGRILYTGDVAYAFGCPPAYVKGRQLMGGKCTSTKSDKLFERHTKGNVHRKMFTGKDDEEYHLPHPCPRRLQHVAWLVHQFSDTVVCDPFIGSGTTAVAAINLNRYFIGIEISKEYCDVAIDRIKKETAQYKMDLV